MKELVFWAVAVIWGIGYICEMAKVTAAIDKGRAINDPTIISKGTPAVIAALWILMFFTWPFWFFYR